MPARKLAPPPPEPSREKSAQSKASFLRMVSHELRTPLNSIIGFSELLNAQPYGALGAPEYLEYAQIIRDSGRKMLKLIGQVMEMVRLRDGLAHLENQPLLVSAPLQDALDLIRGEAAARNVSMTLTERADASWAWGDSRGLRTVASNLIQNAVQFSPPGGEVRVEVRSLAGRVLIEVLDRGPGIAPEDIERVLRPFDQGDYALTRRTYGAGLGLPTAQLLCERMEGDLVLANREGGGLLAQVSLQAASPAEVVENPSRA